MEKVLTLGDPHIHLATLSEIDELEVNMIKIIQERQPDMMVILGDMVHTFETLHLVAWNRILRFVWSMHSAMQGKPIKYIIGNHDAINNQIFCSNDHWFNAFKLFDPKLNIEIIDRPKIIKTGHIGVEFVMMPYVAQGRFREALDMVDWNRPSVKAIFCHQEFRGVKMGAKISKSPDRPPGSPIAIVGHVHDRQDIPGAHMPGTAYHTAFGETGSKYLDLYTFTADDAYSVEAIPSGVPHKKSFYVNVAEAMKLNLESGNKYRVRILDTTENIMIFKKSNKYKELQKISKVVTKTSDKLAVRRESAFQSFDEILQDRVSKNSVFVQKAHKEVSGIVLKTV